jgi:predicted transcriptional regulator
MQMFEVLTAARVRMVEVARTKPYSVTALAKKLKRDPKSVRRDVQKLEQAGVLRTRQAINPGHGRVKIVEPVAQSFELRARF